jgi:exodeoxyribonuclease VII large subunit
LPVYSLHDLNQHIRATVEDTYPEAIWVRAEIAGFNLNTFSGHCYLELSDGQGQQAKAKAMIWKKTYEVLQSKFRIQTGTQLEKGLRVQLLVKVEFNVQYGLSLVVWDIDASYTMGDLAIRKAEVVNRLKKDGIVEQNKQIRPAFPSQRIAVISSPTAAGLEDFQQHILQNEYGFAYSLTLFPAQMQGKDAGVSIASAFDEIRNPKAAVDLVVLIRGGGSSLDLQIFDEYEAAAAICECPLPVFTGIGHERDESVCDLVAHSHFKTPTAVAHHLIDLFLEADSQVVDLVQTMAQNMSWMVRKQEQEFENASFRIYRKIGDHIQKEKQLFQSILHQTIRVSSQQVYRNEAELDSIEKHIRLVNPQNILRLGYARIFQDGNRKKSKSEINEQVPVTIQFQDGTLLTKTKS